MGVRSCISILMNLVLALTFLQAPFLHVHGHESTEHHPHAFFHTHFPHHHFSASKSPEFRGLDPDDDAVFQQWFSATINDISTPVFMLTSIYTLVPVRSSELFFEPNILSGHDPPRRSRSSPRSPPV
ncbi:hypothetical protein [Edaphobacter modestus]|uniref:hypothetical protein n=1 Tax=Edaphobacter modestus TaxID=388466 RepID=UPI00102BAA5F|nr:hypothetical protein [Edaphobacter modestus]